MKSHTMDSKAKKITVFGATGKQGGSVCRSLIANPNFQVRGITRNPESEASKSLSTLGVEIFNGDGWNLDEMRKAFAGSWAVFINTNSFEPEFLTTGGPSELDLGKGIVDSAIQAGVQHLVYSTWGSCEQLTGGKLSSQHDRKHETEQYIRSCEKKVKSATFIGAGWYLENFLDRDSAELFGGFPFTPDEDGYLTYRIPYFGGNGEVPFVDILGDFGDIVHGIFLDPERWNGRIIHAISEMATQQDICRDFEKLTGQKSRFLPILPSYKAFETFGSPELEILKSLMGLTQLTEGRCFGPGENNIKDAKELKEAVCQKLGRQDKVLTSISRWFQGNIGQGKAWSLEKR